MSSETTWHDSERDKSHRGPLVDRIKDYRIIDCRTCGFKHSIPIPAQAELDRYYCDSFYTETKPDYVEQHATDAEWWSLVYEERFVRFEQALGRKGRLLDIACGPGYFLKNGKRLGWQVLGVEPSKRAAEHARTLGVEVVVEPFHVGLLDSLSRFDVVQINQSLEHFPDVHATVDHCRALIADGGLLSIIVANDYNPLQQILRDHLGFEPWWVVPPEHINYFEPDSLRSILERHGFEVLNLTTTFPLDVFLLMGENYLGNPDIGKACHTRRKNLDFALTRSGNADLRARLYRAFAEMGIGRHIDILGRKR